MCLFVCFLVPFLGVGRISAWVGRDFARWVILYDAFVVWFLYCVSVGWGFVITIVFQGGGRGILHRGVGSVEVKRLGDIARTWHIKSLRPCDAMHAIARRSK